MTAEVGELATGGSALRASDAERPGAGDRSGARLRVLDLEPASYQRHPLHLSDRIWTETNCYVDVWIELLHALGRDPVAATMCAFSADFDGEQWQFLKFDDEDLRLLYGIDVREMNVWRPVHEHVAQKIRDGQFLTVEVDSWYLPDTAGAAYRVAHTKSTIVPNEIDLAARRLGYFHNAGYWELTGADFDGLFRLADHHDPAALVPYVETIRLAPAGSSRDHGDHIGPAVDLARQHLARAPEDNPAERLGQRVLADLDWIAGHGLDAFHLYSFGTLRQFGLTAELAASATDWLSAHGQPVPAGVTAPFLAASTIAKSVQFRLARIAMGRRAEVADSITELATAWADGISGLREWAATGR